MTGFKADLTMLLIIVALLSALCCLESVPDDVALNGAYWRHKKSGVEISLKK